MKTVLPRLSRDSRGLAHVLLVVIVLVVVGAIGAVGYLVVSKQKNNGVGADPIAKAIAEAKCDDADKDICKFMASFKAHQSYTMTAKTTADGKTNTSVMQIDTDKKSHMTMTGETNYEIIVIDGTTYTKAPNGTWWKQKANETTKAATDAYKQDFSEDSEDDKSTPEAPKTTYKKLGTEACGKLTCFKYQVIDPTNTDTTEYIWFDTKDYQLQRMRSESKEGGVTEMTYSYEKVSITVPSPVKDLGTNQYLMPGQSEPTTLPDASSLQQGLGDPDRDVSSGSDDSE